MTSKRAKIGVNVSADTRGATRFGAKVVAGMSQLGVNIARIASPIVDASDSWGKIHKPMADAGVRFIWTFREDYTYLQQVLQLLKFEAKYPGQTIGMEGPNEPDLNPVTFGGKTDKRLAARTDTKSAAIALTQALRNNIRTHPELAALKVFPFCDYMPSQQRAFTSMGNSHIYPNGDDLTKHLATVQTLAKQSTAGQVLLGEWGYTTDVSSGFKPVTYEQQAANYARDLAFIMSRPEIPYACAYTMADFPSDVTEQNRFGLFESDWTPKPAVAAFAALA